MKKTAKKRLYTTPRLRVIALETNEVMAIACKAGGGDMNVGLPSCGVDVPCALSGS